MGPVGVQEMIVIFLVALVLFGPKKLPELGKTLGKALTEFRRAQSELKSTFETHMRELERETESLKSDVNHSLADSHTNYEHQYDSPYYDSGAYGSEPYSSTEASSSTASASATQGAESTVSYETTGTVPRSTEATHEEVQQSAVAGQHSKPESNVNG
ncbi:MAG: twin-arginine translocase TatA/TatE family subunit [Acidobacteriaceae bacterium]|nr:twin-arginine translocase TatA/TatE family subunit [Acidobacteriaceae bacterium]